MAASEPMNKLQEQATKGGCAVCGASCCSQQSREAPARAALPHTACPGEAGYSYFMRDGEQANSAATPQVSHVSVVPRRIAPMRGHQTGGGSSARPPAWQPATPACPRNPSYAPCRSSLSRRRQP
jgi:hypothetical protein